MRFFLVVAIIVILVGMLFISLDNMAYYGISSLILAGISSFALFRIFKFLLGGSKVTNKPKAETTDQAEEASPFDYIIFGDIANEVEPSDWTK